MSVFDILEQLEATSGSNAKNKILADNKDNKELVELLDAALNFKRKFFIKKFDPELGFLTTHPKWTRPSPLWRTATNHEMFMWLLEQLQARTVTGHDAQRLLNSHFHIYDEDEMEAKWYRRVIFKDLKCDFGISSCKKAGIDIPEFEVMLAKDGKECKKLKEIVGAGVYVSPKFNGYRCLAVSTDGQVTLYSRNGMPYPNFPQIVEALEKIGGNFVLDGEIMSDDFNKMQQSALAYKRGTTVGDVYYAVFGWVPVDEWEKQEFKMLTKQRLDALDLWFDLNIDNCTEGLLRKVTHKLLYSVDDCMAYEKQALAAGYEGAMLLPNIPYYLGKKSNKLLKLKTFQSMDCPVLKMYEGEGKYVGTLGGLTVMQENGVECDVGSGFTDEDRDVIWNNPQKFIGRIAEVQYQEIQKPHNRMQFPTFQRWRDLGKGYGKI